MIRAAAHPKELEQTLCVNARGLCAQLMEGQSCAHRPYALTHMVCSLATYVLKVARADLVRQCTGFISDI
jgi:hypothetical protein